MHGLVWHRLVQLDPQLFSFCVRHGRLQAILPPRLAVNPFNMDFPVQAAVAHKGVEGSLNGVQDLVPSEQRQVVSTHQQTCDTLMRCTQIIQLEQEFHCMTATASCIRHKCICGPRNWYIGTEVHSTGEILAARRGGGPGLFGTSSVRFGLSTLLARC